MNIPIDTFLQSVKGLCTAITETELAFLESGLTVVELAPKHFYIHAETIQRDVGFVHSGLVRCFYLDQKGNEITVNFVPEGQYATHYPAFISQTPSRYHFQCIEPTTLVCLSYDHIHRCYEKYPVFERYGRLVTEEVLKVQQQRIESFLFSSAEDRYLDFMLSNPSLFNRVSLSYLASYIGIERQSLARIRKKVSQRRK
jgi:CRP-like cAMP-binding protein